jgi:hypothetical protein
MIKVHVSSGNAKETVTILFFYLILFLNRAYQSNQFYKNDKRLVKTDQLTTEAVCKSTFKTFLICESYLLAPKLISEFLVLIKGWTIGKKVTVLVVKVY